MTVSEQRKLATRIDTLRDGKEEHIDLTENDLVFITNGGCVENSSIGDQNTPAPFNTEIRERRRLGYVAQDRRAGPVFRSPG